LAQSGQLEDAPPPQGAQSEAALPAIPFPVALALVAMLLTVVLGVNEHLLARLPLLADEGRR